MHLSKLLVYQVQKGLHLEDSELGAVRGLRLVWVQLRKIFLAYVETQCLIQRRLPFHKLPTWTCSEVSAVDSSDPNFCPEDNDMSGSRLRYAHLVNSVISHILMSLSCGRFGNWDIRCHEARLGLCQREL